MPVTVLDGKGGSFVGTVVFTPVNPGPDAVDGTQNVPATGPSNIHFLTNDTDPDGDRLTVSSATLTDASNGTLTQNADSTWSFTPANGVSGPVEIVYTITDQDGATDTAKHTITVGKAPSSSGGQTAESPEPKNESRPALNHDNGGQLFVLLSVAQSSTVNALDGSGAAFQTPAPLRGEAMVQAADSLLFDSGSRAEAVQLLREPGYGAVKSIANVVYVQQAVRYEALSTDASIWVQRSVRASQLDAAIRSIGLDAQFNSASEGQASLKDPFALGALSVPRAGVTEVTAVDGPRTVDNTSNQSDQGLKSVAVPGQVAASKTASENAPRQRPAMGLRSQLEQVAKARALKSKSL